MKAFFKDLKVVELASVLAGPAVGLFFAELGAEVIKVENKRTGGDVTRGWKLPDEAPEQFTSAYYASVNWGKKAMLLDLSVEADQQKVHDHIREADIVISNFKDSSARRMKMDYKTLKALKPDLIYAQLYAFGQDNHRPAFDVVLQAEAGFLYMTGEPGGAPVKMPVALIDLLAAHQLKEGILMALLERTKTGKGSFVSTSLLEAAVASLANQATNWLIGSHIPGPMGTAHPNIAPYGDVFSCRDGRLIVIAAGAEKQFQNLCKALNLTALLNDERFRTNTQRVTHRLALWDQLQACIVQYDRDPLAQLLEKQAVPFGRIHNMKEVFEMPETQHLILEGQSPEGHLQRCVRTVVFNLKTA